MPSETLEEEGLEWAQEELQNKKNKINN